MIDRREFPARAAGFAAARGEGYDFLKLWDGLPADGTGICTSGPYKQEYTVKFH